MSNIRNHWVTLPDEGVALWWAVLPHPSKNPDALVAFGSRVVDAGKRHRVWDMHRYSAGAGPGDTFEHHVRGAMAEGRLPFLIRRGEDPEPSGTVATYQGDVIVEVVTSDLGQLLRELRPERNRRVTESAPPVVVRGGSYTMDGDEQISVTVRLDSDIWFPRVVGLREDLDDDSDDFPDWYDNAGLASRHTPRFNAFLEAVREATIAAHGEWHFDQRTSGLAHRYLASCDSDGIML